MELVLLKIQCPCCWKIFKTHRGKNGIVPKYCSSKCSKIENQFNFTSKARKKLRKGNYKTVEEHVATANLEPSEPPRELVLTQGEPITPVQRVVESFKRITGHRNDREWDKQFFKRYSVAALRMIDYLGDYKLAVMFVTETYESLSVKGFAPFTMEALEKHMAPWKLDRLEKVRDE